MPNNPREKKAFDFVPAGSVNVPIPLTPSQGKREWEEEEEGALVYRYVKGIRWEKGTLSLSLSLSLAGRSEGRSSSTSKSIQISSPLAPTLLSSSLARRKVSPPAVSKVSPELQHFWVLLAQIGAGRSAGLYSSYGRGVL